MGVHYRFISDPREPSPVLDWFRSSDNPPKEVSSDERVVLYFANCGSLTYSADGTIDPKRSPVATLFPPQIKRGALWTVGEVHFLATPLRKQFPELQKVNSAFRKWLSSFECVYSNLRTNNEFDYYLEGSIRNYDSPVHAFDSGLAALKSGQYFIADDDNDNQIDKICRTLSLRGIDCTP